MSDQPDRDGEAATEGLKPSLRNTVEKMGVSEITALIEFAEQTRRHKQEAARSELLAEFQKRASELGLSLESLVEPTRAGRLAKPLTSAKKLVAKYRGPNGEEWTGRGRSPTWLTALESQGKKREQFAV